jgi:hypothetical protein
MLYGRVETCKVTRKPEVKRPLGRPSSRWKYNIKIDLKEIRWQSLDLII